MNEHAYDGLPAEDAQPAAGLTRGEHNDEPESERLRAGVARHRSGPAAGAGELDLARWNAIAYDYAELEQLPAIGQRVLGVNGSMMTWARASEVAQPGARPFARSLPTWCATAVAAGDVETGRRRPRRCCAQRATGRCCVRMPARCRPPGRSQSSRPTRGRGRL